MGRRRRLFTAFIPEGGGDAAFERKDLTGLRNYVFLSFGWHCRQRPEKRSPGVQYRSMSPLRVEPGVHKQESTEQLFLFHSADNYLRTFR